MKLCISTLFIVLGFALSGQTTWVTSLADDTTAGTLRYALNNASPGDSIRFSPILFSGSSDTIHLDSALVIRTPVHLQGHISPNDTLFISGGDSLEWFRINIDSAYVSHSISLDSLALIHGRNAARPAFDVYSKLDLEIAHSIFSHSNATNLGILISLRGDTAYAPQLSLMGNTWNDNNGLGLIDINQFHRITLEDNDWIDNANPSIINVFTPLGSVYANRNTLMDNMSFFSPGGMKCTIQSDSLMTDSLVAIGSFGRGAFYFEANYQHHTHLWAEDNINLHGPGGMQIVWDSTGGPAPLVEKSTFLHNRGLVGGGIYASAMTLKESLVRGNRGIDDAGGIYGQVGRFGTIALIDCQVDSNYSAQRTGGIYCPSSSHLYLNRVTVSYNSCGWSSAGVRTGYTDTVTLLNSTFSGNVAGDLNGGVSIEQSDTAVILHCTFANNQSVRGGGLSFLTNSNLWMGGSLVAQNTPEDIYDNPFNPFIFHSLGNNLVDSTPVRSSFIWSDIINPNSGALIDSLQDNGGWGWTHLPVPGSWAVNNGIPTTTMRAQNDSILGGRRDIGAAESSDSTRWNMETMSICDSALIRGNWVSTPTTLLDTATSAWNTDSIYVLRILDIYETQYVHQTFASCDPITWLNGITYSQSVDSAGVLLTSQHGCDSIVSMSFTRSLVDTSINILYYQGLTNNSQNVDFTWVSCPNYTPISFAQNDSFFSPIVNGTYAVILSGPDGCTDTSECAYFTWTSVSENEPNTIRIYPNPSSGDIVITIPESTNESWNASLLNLDGKQLFSQNDLFAPGELQAQWSLNFLPPGVYILRLASETNTLTHRIVIQ